MFRKYLLIAIPSLIIALAAFLLLGSISTNQKVKLAQYEHCLSQQNQALTLVFEEYKDLPKEDNVSNFDRLLSLVKADPDTGKVEWMTTSLDICEQYLP